MDGEQSVASVGWWSPYSSSLCCSFLVSRQHHRSLEQARRALDAADAGLRGERQGISSPDIRAGIALLIAALCADGKTVIRNIGQIDRGYEGIEEKLLKLGAKIERSKD